MFTDENMSGFLNKVIQKLFDLHARAEGGKGIIRNVGKLDVYREWMYSSSTVYRFIEDMTVEVDVAVDHQKDAIFGQYNEYCDFHGIPKEDRMTDLATFGKELINKCGAHKVHVGTGPNAYIYRMFREYDRGHMMPRPPEDYGFVPPDDDDDGAFNFVPTKREID